MKAHNHNLPEAYFKWGIHRGADTGLFGHWYSESQVAIRQPFALKLLEAGLLGTQLGHQAARGKHGSRLLPLISAESQWYRCRDPRAFVLYHLSSCEPRL